jgi:hypothetical protein
MYHITVRTNGAAKDHAEGITIDGKPVEQEPAAGNEAGKSAAYYIQLVDDGQEHEVEVVMPHIRSKTSAAIT